MRNFIARLRNKRFSASAVVIGIAVAIPVLLALNPLAASTAQTKPRQAATPKRMTLRERIITGRLSGAGDVAHAALATQSQLASSLAVFRRSGTSSDEVPAATLVHLGPLAGMVDRALGRRALVTTTGNAVYLVPSAEGVCLIDTSGSQGGCFPTSTAVTTGAVQSDDCSGMLPSPETIEISGVIPDSASSAVVVLSNGASQPLDVEGNAFIAQFSRKGPLPTRIVMQTHTGSVSIGAAVPADVANEQCVTSVSEYKALRAAGRLRK